MEEANICLIRNYQDGKVTSQFCYQDLFHICNKLTKETCKLEQVIFAPKTLGWYDMHRSKGNTHCIMTLYIVHLC